MTPTISTARLSLRQLIKASSTQVRWLQDADVTRYSEQRHQQHNLSSQLRFVASYGGRSHLWGIYLIETGDHIGNLSATHDDPNNVSEVGMMIGEPDCWGKGYGREAWLHACEWLLDRNGGQVRKLEAGCMQNNEAMAKIIRYAGFKQEGELKNHFLFEGMPISALLFGRFA